MSRIGTVEQMLGAPIKDLNQFFGFRLPKPPPADDNADVVPGRLCWGQVGSLPSAELVEGDSFETVNCDEQHDEVTRETQDVRIENPEEPEDWVEVERPNTFRMNKKETTKSPSSNTDTAAADFGDFSASPIQLSSFKPLGTETTKQCKLTIKMKNTQRAA